MASPEDTDPPVDTHPPEDIMSLEDGRDILGKEKDNLGEC